MSAVTAIPTDWNSQCMALIRNASNFTEGLVNGLGQHVAKLDETAWGVNISTCYKYCGSIRFPVSHYWFCRLRWTRVMPCLSIAEDEGQWRSTLWEISWLVNTFIPSYTANMQCQQVFNFPRFAGTFTNFLLPWLALTAQLPYEARDAYKNIISFCLAVGSPALITYSLVLTILNRYWIRNQFQELLERARDRGVNNKYRAFNERVAAAQYLLQEAQQVPLRASQDQGWLSSLIVVPGNEEWWQNLKNRLAHSRRGVTVSLAFQLLAAILAWIFTVSAAFKSSLGDGTQGLDISSGSTWIWLVRNSIHFFWVLAKTPMATKNCASVPLISVHKIIT